LLRKTLPRWNLRRDTESPVRAVESIEVILSRGCPATEGVRDVFPGEFELRSVREFDRKLSDSCMFLVLRLAPGLAR
jgi:hypothetical protein